MKSEHKAYIALLLAMLCWSTSGIAIKQALIVLTPLTLIIFRFTLSVTLMFLVGKIAGLFAKNATLPVQSAGEQPQNLVENNFAGNPSAFHNQTNLANEADEPSSSDIDTPSNPVTFENNLVGDTPQALTNLASEVSEVNEADEPSASDIKTLDTPTNLTNEASEASQTTHQPASQLAINPLTKADIPLFLFAGFLQPFLYYLAETYAYQLLSSPTIAEALLSTCPLLSPIFAFVAIRERISRQTLLGIFISTVGMLLLTLHFSDSFSLGNPWGILLAFLAVTMAIFYTIYLKKIPEHYNSLSIVFYVQLFSLCFFYPAWLLQGGIDQLHQLTTADPQALHKAMSMVAYLAVFSSIVAFVLFCYAVRIVGVSKANAFNNIRPVFTAIIMLIFFGELLPAVKWIGILLVVIGLFYSSKQST